MTAPTQNTKTTTEFYRGIFHTLDFLLFLSNTNKCKFIFHFYKLNRLLSQHLMQRRLKHTCPLKMNYSMDQGTLKTQWTCSTGSLETNI